MKKNQGIFFRKTGNLNRQTGTSAALKRHFKILFLAPMRRKSLLLYKSRLDENSLLETMHSHFLCLFEESSLPRVQKTVADVCLNKALKGDVRAFERLLQLVIKLKVFDQTPGDIPIVIRRVIVDPQGMERPLPL